MSSFETSLHPDREVTNRGLPRDIEANVLKLCQDAFKEEDYLSFLEYPKDVDTGDLMKARLTDLPAMRVWVSRVDEDTNQTGAALGRKQRELLTFQTVIVYCTDYATTRGGDDIVKEVGWGLRDKLAENTTLFGLAHIGAGKIQVDYEPDLVNLNGKLYTVDCVRIVIDYKLVRMRRRAQPNT